MTELFFNGRDWRALLNEQQVRFLEELYDRAGGAQAPEQNLQQINDSLTLIENIAKSSQHEIEHLKRLLSEEEDSNGRLLTFMRRLEHRISQLEDAQ